MCLGGIFLYSLTVTTLNRYQLYAESFDLPGKQMYVKPYSSVQFFQMGFVDVDSVYFSMMRHCNFALDLRLGKLFL